MRSVVDFGLQDAEHHQLPELLAGRERGLHRAGPAGQGDDRATRSEHAITIAVMGCRVNGPGETDDADLGLWCGPNFVNLKTGEKNSAHYPYDQILLRLKAELDALIAERAEPAGRRVCPLEGVTKGAGTPAFDERRL